MQIILIRFYLEDLDLIVLLANGRTSVYFGNKKPKTRKKTEYGFSVFMISSTLGKI